jgi:hypothetical protein
MIPIILHLLAAQLLWQRIDGLGIVEDFRNARLHYSISLSQGAMSLKFRVMHNSGQEPREIRINPVTINAEPAL